MSPVIRITDDVFVRLQRHAVPLVDSTSDVISRLLDMAEKAVEVSKDETPPVASSSTAEENAGEPGVNSQHPDYSRAHKVSREIHDALARRIVTTFGADLRVDERTLVFIVQDRNFAAFQRLGIRDGVVGLSLFGSVATFQDPKRVLRQGRFPHWSSVNVTSLADLDYVVDLVAQAKSIRMQGRVRGT